MTEGRETNPTSSRAHVLYIDHKGHPAPLSLCFHATASRRLASSVDHRHPPSTVTEVDSAYCPQCLAFHDADTAASMGYCAKPSCRRCPSCRSIASISVESTTSDNDNIETDCLYKCGKCNWTSRDCGIYTTLSSGNGGGGGSSYSKEELDKAAVELGEQSMSRMSDQDHLAEKHYNKMLQAMEDIAKEKVKARRSGMLSSALGDRKGELRAKGWSVEELEASLANKGTQQKAATLEIVGDQKLTTVSLDDEEELDDSLQGRLPQSLLGHVGSIARSGEHLLPQPIPLRPRKSRRCRAELAEGRPGILLKPKLNPLEGDSSLRTGHGQWWKKDSSANMVLPRVQVIQHASDGVRHVFLVKVTNPTLGTIRMRLKPSSYKGEPMMWRQSSAGDTSSVFNDLIVDSLNKLTIQAKLLTDSTSDIEATAIFQLEAAEDSFLDLGKTSGSDEPVEVSSWNAQGTLSSSTVAPGSNVKSTLKLVAQNSADGWFEVVVLETASDEAPHVAIPLSLEIQVGNGSWESSLIQPRSTEESSGEQGDAVAFDFVIAFASSAPVLVD